MKKKIESIVDKLYVNMVHKLNGEILYDGDIEEECVDQLLQLFKDSVERIIGEDETDKERNGVDYDSFLIRDRNAVREEQRKNLEKEME